MDWRSVRFDWNRARTFLVTAEEGSLSAAARALGMAQPTLGRQVDALEQELGVVLFERAGRGLVLTPSGLELLDHVRAMAEAANRMSLAASGQAQSIEGSICITASEAYSAYLLPPILAKLRDLQPGIAIEIVASNSTVDLRKREADIAIRGVRPTHSELIARKVRDDPVRIYGATEYLEKLGNPATAAELSHADFLGFEDNDVQMNMLNSMGFNVTRSNFPVTTLNHLVQWELVKRGVALGLMLELVGDAEPRVRRALPDLPPIPFPVWLTSHRELMTSRRIRIVYDFLVEELAALGKPVSA